VGKEEFLKVFEVGYTSDKYTYTEVYSVEEEQNLCALFSLIIFTVN